MKTKNEKLTVLAKVTPETWRALLERRINGKLVYSNKARCKIVRVTGDEIVTTINNAELHYRIEDGASVEQRQDIEKLVDKGVYTFGNYGKIRICVEFKNQKEANESEWSKYFCSRREYAPRNGRIEFPEIEPAKNTGVKNGTIKLFADILRAVVNVLDSHLNQ